MGYDSDYDREMRVQVDDNGDMQVSRDQNLQFILQQQHYVKKTLDKFQILLMFHYIEFYINILLTYTLGMNISKDYQIKRRHMHSS